MSESPARKRLLVYCDSPTAPTGLARIVRAAIKYLKDDYDVAVLGWGFDGKPHDYGVHVYPCPKIGNEVVDHATAIIVYHKPDAILCIGDPWNFVHMPQLVNHLRVRSMPTLRWYYLALIDGDPLPGEWEPVFSAPDGLAVTSSYGKRCIQKINKNLDPPVIRLGVDSEFWKCSSDEVYELLGQNDTIRKRFSRDELFTIFWLGVNSNRKNLDALIRAAVPVLAAHEDAHLWMHIAYDTPGGFDIKKLAQMAGLTRGRFSISRPGGMAGATDEEIRSYYGIASVVACPSMGEGNWLPGYEAQACGCVPVATDSSALTETVGGRGELVPVAYEGYFGEWGFLRAFINVEKLSEAFEGLYQDWKQKTGRIEILTGRGRKWAEHHSWKRFADNVRMMLASTKAQFAQPTNARTWVKPKVDLNTEQFAMLCPTFGKNCGIAEYSVALADGLSDNGIFTKNFATRNLSSVLKVCRESGIALLHLQHEYSFWSHYDMAELYRELAEAGIATVTTMHTATVAHDANRAILEGSTATVVHSDLQRKILLKAKADGKVRVIPTGAPMAMLWDRETLRVKNGYKNGDFVIGSYGFLRPQKGYDILFHALLRLPEHFKLMIFASEHEFGAAKYDEEVMAYIEKIGLQDRVQVMRERLQTKAQVVNLLQVADVLALAYRDFGKETYVKEGGGTESMPVSVGVSSAVMDCAAAARPLLLTDTSCFGHIPREAAVWVPAENHDPVVEAVLKLEAEPDLRAELAHHAQQLAWDRRWPAVAAQHARVYKAILEGREIPCNANES